MRDALARATVVALLLCWWPPTPAAADDARALFAALRAGRAVALIRHASAPGSGDPAGFRLDDCTTQRNLSEAGRLQARALGERLRAQGIAAAEIFASQWCRARETAALLGLGAVQPLPALNSLFGAGDDAEQTTALETFLRAQRPAAPLLLVTHQTNIRALTGAGAGAGEIILIDFPLGGEISVLGRIPPPG